MNKSQFLWKTTWKSLRISCGKPAQKLVDFEKKFVRVVRFCGKTFGFVEACSVFAKMFGRFGGKEFQGEIVKKS